MKFFVLALLFAFAACTSSVTIPTSPAVSTRVDVLDGKWSQPKNGTKIYFEEALEKVVLTDGCQVVSANYKRIDPAIHFFNIIATHQSCEGVTLSLEDLLKQTIIIKQVTKNQIAFYNAENQSLLILDKN